MKNSERLKVLSFTTLFPNLTQPLHGLFVKNRLEHMAQLCDLSVVAPVNGARDPRRLWSVPLAHEETGLRVLHPRFGVVPGLFKSWDGDLLFWQTLYQVRRLLSLDTFDLIDAHYAYPDGVAGEKLARRIGKPFVVTLRGSDIHLLPRYRGRRRRIQQMLGRADAIIALSEALKREAEALGADPGKIHVIPNGVARAIFHAMDLRAARERLGWPLEAQVILSVGRLTRIKRFDLLIRAMNLLCKRRPEKSLRCFIVGEGEERVHLAREIRQLRLENDVILAGPVFPQELPLWYNASNLFCLLSESEGSPNVVLESLACGTPVAASAVGGVTEAVRDGVNGLLIRSRTEEEVARQIDGALRMKWDKTSVAKSAGLRDWSEVACALVQLFHDTLRSHEVPARLT